MTDKHKEFQSVTIAGLTFPPREGGYVKGHETREQILYAALTILVEEGYQAMSLRRVAAECGMKLGNLTYHFASREDLVRDLLDALIRSYEQEFDVIAHMPDVDPEERLAELCNVILEDIRTKKTTRIFPELWALSNHDTFVLDRVQDLYARARLTLNEIVSEMRPDLPDDVVLDIALFISASMEGLTVFAGHGKPFEPRMPKLEDIAIKSFINLVKCYRPDDDSVLP